MGADNRRIDKELAGQRTALRLDAFPELAPEPAPFPAAKAVRDCVPASKRLWQVAPWRPRAGKREDGFNNIRPLSTGGLPARDLIVARMGAISPRPRRSATNVQTSGFL